MKLTKTQPEVFAFSISFFFFFAWQHIRTYRCTYNYDTGYDSLFRVPDRKLWDNGQIDGFYRKRVNKRW